MLSSVPISQQYLLASKARAKLVKCASTEHNKDYDLRVLVGHANLLDRVMESVDCYNSRATKNAISKKHASTHSRSEGHTVVDYFSSDDEEDEDDYCSSSSCSDSDDDSSSSGSDYEGDDDAYEFDAEQPPKYTPLSLMRPQQPTVSMVTVTIDQCLDKGFGDESNSDTESEPEECAAAGMGQDLSMMPLTLRSSGDKEHYLHHSMHNHEFSEVTPIQV